MRLTPMAASCLFFTNPPLLAPPPTSCLSTPRHARSCCPPLRMGRLCRFNHPAISHGTRYSRQQQQQRQQHREQRGSGAALAVWKQEVLWAEAPVARVEKAAERLFHVVLDISNNIELRSGHKTAGQFVQVRVGDSKPAFMAIASPPRTAASGYLEFLIKYLEGSTAGLLCSLRKGDRVELSQVMGNGFPIERLYPPEDYSTVLLFATGSGISPIRSLIEAGFEAHERSDVRLYYGARSLQKMAYKDKFREWESSGVKIIPVLSQPSDDWSRECGYVQAAFSKSTSVFNPFQTGAVLCGHKQMVQDATSLLVARGVSLHNILKNF